MFPVLQRTTQVTNQRHSTSLTLICVKMASVMGVTWILGIAANVHALSFLWYPYVVLNSLQGNFKVTRPSFFFLGGGGYHPTLKLSGIPTFTFIVSLTHRMDNI